MSCSRKRVIPGVAIAVIIRRLNRQARIKKNAKNGYSEQAACEQTGFRWPHSLLFVELGMLDCASRLVRLFHQSSAILWRCDFVFFRRFALGHCFNVEKFKSCRYPQSLVVGRYPFHDCLVFYGVFFFWVINKMAIMADNDSFSC